MPEQVEAGNFFERLAKNQNLVALAGLLMFFLGLISWFMAMAENEITEARMKATLSSVLLLSMGYPLLLHVGVQRKLKAAEDRIKSLEGAIERNSPTDSEERLEH